ncbi:mitochondrial import inner membrane translocase subunit Tim21-like [Hypomesus transpacificus]|uniref:mitochondrial import inner membrane translocase subunit Tim21-like n=1 Tax=Hypomesus transpacificus TaxID=137520 RepID=UPI001F083421|nr:mitochondrial import inner membrane translocase subunit Tim21-like [Hypomesus transpacificus]
MIYSFVLKSMHRNLQQAVWIYGPLQICKRTQSNLILQRRCNFVSTSTPFFHGIEGHPSILGSVLCTQKRKIYFHTSLRNKIKPEETESGQLSTSRLGTAPNFSAAQKVKEAGKDFTYLIVVLIGLGVTGGLLYVVFQELFSTSSPSKIYGKAFDKTRLNPEVIGAFGEPIKCYGETTRRGRRQQVSHAEFMKDGLKHMRLKFYIEGDEPGRKGTVHSESKENPETGKYEFRYIFVEVDTYPRRTIVVEDNR